MSWRIYKLTRTNKNRQGKVEGVKEGGGLLRQKKGGLK